VVYCALRCRCPVENCVRCFLSSRYISISGFGGHITISGCSTVPPNLPWSQTVLLQLELQLYSLRNLSTLLVNMSVKFRRFKIIRVCLTSRLTISGATVDDSVIIRHSAQVIGLKRLSPTLDRSSYDATIELMAQYKG